MLTPRVAQIFSELASLSAQRAALETELAAALRVPAPARLAPELPEYLTTREAAALVGVSVRTLEALRAEGRGPRFVRIGRAVRYPRDTVQLPSGGKRGRAVRGAPTPKHESLREGLHGPRVSTPKSESGARCAGS
jgi:excisionase family DNA binding protein